MEGRRGRGAPPEHRQVSQNEKTWDAQTGTGRTEEEEQKDVVTCAARVERRPPVAAGARIPSLPPLPLPLL